VGVVGKLGVATLALVVSAVPTMACLLPWTTLTAAEHECCKQMACQCGRMGMPSSHSCCQRLAGPDDVNFVKVQSPQVGTDVIIAVHLAPAMIQPVVPLSSNHFASGDWFNGLHGPPESPPVSTTILRI
jgi:hypothetical protein